jgi:putative SOS response-associated peptidase YedK
MCGRFTLHHESQEIIDRFGVQEILFELKPRYNIAPTQSIAVITQSDTRTLSAYKWGLIPSWAQDPQIASKMINARSETLAEKPSFKKSLVTKRCIIPVDGFYEWQQVGKNKIPLYACMKNQELFALAGLWDEWQAPNGAVIRSCTIITVEPNPLLAKVHHRMAAILSPDDESTWLDPNLKDVNKLLGILKTYPDNNMQLFPVSKAVNNTSFDSPECIKPTGKFEQLIEPIQETLW